VIWLIFQVNAKDVNTPFRLLRGQTLKKYLAIIPNDFFLVNTLLTVLFLKNKEKVGWLPIEFLPRAGGISSINLKKIFKVGLRSIKDLYRFKKTKFEF
jgi:hypothetical protein